MNARKNSRQSDATSNDYPREFLAFQLGKREFGIDIRKVQELRGYGAVTEVPHAPAFIKGVINLRGTIVPIIDMRIKLVRSMPTYDQCTEIIILNISNHVVGLVVDSVSGAMTLDRDQIQSLPEVGNGLEANYLIGFSFINERKLILLNADYLVSNSEMQLLEKITNLPLPLFAVTKANRYL